MIPYLRLVENDDIHEPIIAAGASQGEPFQEQPLPGASRREWVYREMGLLESEPSPWLEPQD